jgi:hypothetical protein
MMWWIYWILHVPALAAVPDAVRPSIAPWDIQEQHNRWRQQQGEPAQVLACRTFWTDQAKLCFRIVHGDRRQWVTESHLGPWGVDFDGLKKTVVENGALAIHRQLKPVPIPGMSEQYWLASNEAGWSAGVLLQPTAFAAVGSGTNLMAAVPAHGIVLLWQGGNPEVDKVVAIGVREIYATEAGAVTPLIYWWTGSDWTVFGEAKKRPDKK